MKLSYNDRQHAYWLDGKRCKGVTSIAKIPDDTYGLDKWKLRQVVTGMAINPVLVKRAAAHHDERDQLDTIAEEALVSAKANDASGLGTAAHRVTERIDLGLDWIDTPEHRHIETQWKLALQAAGLEVVPEYVERIVVYPDDRVCGRFDRICRVIDPEPINASGVTLVAGQGDLIIVDVKTGESAVKYPHSTTIQLATYANAPLMAGPLTRDHKGNEVTETFEPLPDELNPHVGVIVYLPAEGDAETYALNLSAGWDTAERICFPTVRWRKRNDLCHKIAATTTHPAVRVADDPTADVTSSPVLVASAERVTWITDRVKLIYSRGHKLAWPVGLPVKKFAAMSDDEIDRLLPAVEQAEAAAGLPFGPPDPTKCPNPECDNGVVSIGPASDGYGACTTCSPPEPSQNDTVMADPDTGEIVDPLADAKTWTDKCWNVLDEFNTEEQIAITALVHGLGHNSTERHHQYLTAIVDELGNPNGAVMLAYTADGPTVEATDAHDQVRRGAGGTKAEALRRGKRLAKELDVPAPRTFDQVCATPALAALVAAGLGGAETNTSNDGRNRT